MKVLIATEKPFAKEALEAIKQEIISGGHSVDVLEKYADKSQLLSAVSDANAMIVRSDVIDKSVITAANDLKIVVRAGAGYDTIDTDYAKTKGVIVEKTYSNTTIKSDYFIVQSKGNNFLHLGIKQENMGSFINGFDVIPKKDSWLETYFIENNNIPKFP